MASILFYWQGYDRHGRLRSGRAWSVSRIALEQRLSSFLYGILIRISGYMMLFPLWWRQWWSGLSGRTLLSASQAGQACATLSTLMKAQVPLVTALRLVASGAADTATATVFTLMAEHAVQGEAIAACFVQTASWWPSVVPIAVAAGMERGELAEVLEQLSDSLQAYEQYRRELWRALIIPLVTISIAVTVFSAITTFLLPLVADVSPALSGIVEHVRWVEQWGLSLFWIVCVSAVFFWRAFSWYHRLHCWRDRLLYNLPLFGTTLRAVHAIITVRLWCVLVRAGVPLYAAIRAGASVPQNAWWQREMLEVAGRLRAGCSLSYALAQGPLPPLMRSLFCFASGAQQLIGMGEHALMVQEQALRYQLDMRLALLQPALLLLIGGGVVWLISSFLGPLLNLTG